MLLVSFSNPKYKQYEGRRMNEVIAVIGKPPIDVLFELLEENRGSVPTVYFHHSEEDMKYALRQPFASIGSDGTAVTEKGPLAAGNPHPRYYGTFPRVLGKYVREEKVISLEEAIRKITSANTAKIHVIERFLFSQALRNAARDGGTFGHNHFCFVPLQGNQKLHAFFRVCSWFNRSVHKSLSRACRRPSPHRRPLPQLLKSPRNLRRLN